MFSHQHLGSPDEGSFMQNVRGFLQKVLPVCGDLLLGDTQVRKQPLPEVNVPEGAHVLISNNRHAHKPSEESDIRQRLDALLGKELPYDLFKLNCEHFATFARYGVAVCNQVGLMQFKFYYNSCSCSILM